MQWIQFSHRLLPAKNKMNTFTKTILIISITVFGVGILSVPSASAQNNNLVAQFEQAPLFNEANFLPGQGVTRWVKVTNNSTQTQRIATEAINVSDSNRLADVLNLEIKQGGATLYNNTLSQFFTAGEVFLCNLSGNGTQTQYDFIITFYSEAGSHFQGKSLSFDILIGFQGEGGGLLPGAGGGAGGFLPPGLTIPEESVRITNIEETSVTIVWLTSYPATSQVIYSAEGEPHTLDLTKPNYGYAHATPVPEDSTKVSFHSVTIYGLNPTTTYYYRAVSHASFAVSREYTFTTRRLAEIEEVIQHEPETGASPEEKKEIGIPLGEIEGPIIEEETLAEIFREEGWLAAIGVLPFNLKLIIILALAVILGLITLWLFRRRRQPARHSSS